MKILICDPVDSSVKEHFEAEDSFQIIETFELKELEQQIVDADFLIIRSGTTVTRELMEMGENLIGVVRAGVGLDNVDLTAAEELGVKVKNTPEASTNAVAELVVAHILAAYRDIPRADEQLKQGNWIKKQLSGNEIMGKLVGIVGYGRIGQRTAEILQGFGAETIAYDALLDDADIKSRGASPCSLDELISRSDIISLHVPLTPETKNLISTAELTAMKDSCLLVNCSRGGIIDEAALTKALEESTIAAACLDSYSEEPPGQIPLVESPKTITTPHLGATTEEAQARIASLIIAKIEEMADGV